MSTMSGKDVKYFEPGDLVYFKSNGSPWDFLILLFSKKYTHLGVAVSDNEFVEATVGGVKLTEYKPEWKADIYRVTGLSFIPASERRLKLFSNASRHFGEPYSFSQAIGAGLLRAFGLKHLADKIDRNWFCSEWAVYLIHQAFGIRLNQDLKYADILPEDPLSDSLVYKVD